MTIDEAALDVKLAELEALRAWSPRVISKLEAFVRTPDPWALFRANPFTFAEERGVAEDEAVELFLLASKVGLFQMTWSLLCPGCGDAVKSFTSLRNVCSVFHCFLCSVDLETRLDDFVHVGFTIAPRIRVIPAHDPDALSIEDYVVRYRFAREARTVPGGPRFGELLPTISLALAYVEPHTTRTFHAELETGAIVAYDIVSTRARAFAVSPSVTGPNATLRLRLDEAPESLEMPILAPGPIDLVVENATDQRTSMVILAKPQAMIDGIEAAVRAGKPSGMHFDRFLSGRRLLTCDTFRKAFGTETIRASDGIGVRDVAILFTDLKGSTSMYDRIGDLRAFSLVNQHFERLGRAVVRHRGAVVKTIGDAVMAAFESPLDAVRAARDMLVEIEAFNGEVGEREIVLKVGVHRGASIAVTLNDRLDFFGQTVNIAARVQGLADADEIFLTDAVFRAPGVADELACMQVTADEVTLRGVQKPVAVVRVASRREGTAIAS